MIESDLRNYLVAGVPLTDLIGTRLYLERFPDNPTLPAVVYSSDGNGEDALLDGSGHGLRTRVFRFYILAATGKAAAEVYIAIDGLIEVLGTSGDLRGSEPLDVRSNPDPTTGFYVYEAVYNIFHV